MDNLLLLLYFTVGKIKYCLFLLSYFQNIHMLSCYDEHNSYLNKMRSTTWQTDGELVCAVEDLGDPGTG